MAYRDSDESEKEGQASFTLNNFQALQMLFAIPYLLQDIRVAKIELKLKKRIHLQQDPFYNKLEDP